MYQHRVFKSKTTNKKDTQKYLWKKKNLIKD